MKRGLAVILLCLLPLVAGSGPVDPDSVIPTITESDYQDTGGIFGPASRFKGNELKLLNLIWYMDSRVPDKLVPVDMTVCNSAALPIEDALACLTDILKEDQLYDTDMFLWSKASMTGQEFIEAVEAKMKLMEARVYALENPV